MAPSLASPRNIGSWRPHRLRNFACRSGPEALPGLRQLSNVEGLPELGAKRKSGGSFFDKTWDVSTEYLKCKPSNDIEHVHLFGRVFAPRIPELCFQCHLIIASRDGNAWLSWICAETEASMVVHTASIHHFPCKTMPVHTFSTSIVTRGRLLNMGDFQLPRVSRRSRVPAKTVALPYVLGLFRLLKQSLGWLENWNPGVGCRPKKYARTRGETQGKQKRKAPAPGYTQTR